MKLLEWISGVNKPHLGKPIRNGMVIKMEPGYYTTEPYYVLVKNVTSTGFTTTIPGREHDDLVLDSIQDPRTWYHQVSRMTVVGDYKTHGHLLYDQVFV